MYLRNKRDQADAMNKKLESMIGYYNRDLAKGDVDMKNNMTFAIMGLQQAYMALDITFQIHNGWDGEIIGYESNGTYHDLKEEK